MTEIELKLMLLRYNMLAKKRIIDAYMRRHIGENAHDDNWSKCVKEMTNMETDLRKYGYKFVCISIKTVDEVCYGVYKIVPVNS